MLAQLRRGAQDEGDALQRLGIAMQQAEELHARRQPGQQRIEAAQRLVGVRLAPAGGEQSGHQRGQQLARPLAAGGPGAAMVPAAHHGGDARRVAKPDPAERRQRAGVVLHAGEDQIAIARKPFGGKPRRAFEEAAVMLLHPRQMRHEDIGEGLGRRQAHETRHPGQPGAIFRQAMGLAVGQHLQPMLKGTEEHIGIGEVHRRPPVELPGRGQRRQRAQRGGIAQGRLAPAPDQLQHLHGELDLAVAAASGRSRRSVRKT